MKKILFLACGLASVVLVFTLGHLYGRSQRLATVPFHDLMVIPIADYTRLVDPTHPKIVAAAAGFESYEKAYRYVRDEIRYDPVKPPAPPEVVLLEGSASCLGKITLLCSFYRAMGMPPEQVRVVVGELVHDDSMVEHAWLDLELDGTCYQQDPSGLIGRFEFSSFPDGRFTNTFAHRERFCFNDKSFALVSQLNRLRYQTDGPYTGP